MNTQFEMNNNKYCASCQSLNSPNFSIRTLGLFNYNFYCSLDCCKKHNGLVFCSNGQCGEHRSDTFRASEIKFFLKKEEEEWYFVELSCLLRYRNNDNLLDKFKGIINKPEKQDKQLQ